MTELPDRNTAEIPPQPDRGLSNDARAMLLFEANKKTAVTAYLLWFFVGLFGGHNFYLKRTGVAVTQLILSITIIGSRHYRHLGAGGNAIPRFRAGSARKNLLAIQLGA